MNFQQPAFQANEDLPQVYVASEAGGSSVGNCSDMGGGHLSHLPLSCGWAGCCQVFGTIEHLIIHLTDVHLFASQHCDQPLHCFWNECNNFDAEHHHHLTVHVLYHAYHTQLKALASAAIEKSQISKCQLIAFSSCLPDLPPEGFTCLLNHGTCLETFTSFHSYLVHVRSHIYSPVLTERRCTWMGCERSTLFKTKFYLNNHMRTHTGAKLFACPQCGAQFANVEKLKGHCARQVLEDSAKTFKCSYCNISFASCALLKEHLRTHVKLFQCSKCSLPFAKKSALRNHWKFKHSDERMFPCPMELCYYSAKTRNDLLKHLKSHEHKEKLSCEFCDKKFKTEYGLQCHNQSEHNYRAKPEYVCHLCPAGTSFNRGIYLSLHLIKKHQVERPSGQKFSYIKADDGKFYLARDEFHELDPDLVSGSLSTDFVDSSSNYEPVNLTIPQPVLNSIPEESIQNSDFLGNFMTSTPNERFIDVAVF
ncbi:histone H4 transcription factor-like [Convolutriloba macropyga]|uniref:histone H4 transcription factor-like n=1 Tax=Convolutriloba macropyga TaxID=536237 RepID=UPI003F524883